jgi:type I restriction enzyme R subunit
VQIQAASAGRGGPPGPEYENGDSIDVRQKVREDFYQALRDFSQCLEVALGSAGFYEDKSFSEADRDKYKNDIKFFESLRRIARQDAGETVDYSAYEARIKKLIDKHVVGENIREPEGAYLVSDMGKNANPEDWTEEKTRNETDLIRSRVKRTIEQALQDDPYAQKVFSELLEEAINEAEALFDHPFKQYEIFKQFEEQLNERNVPDMPPELDNKPHAKAYYGVFRIVLGDEEVASAGKDGDTSYVEEAVLIDGVVDKAVAEHSLNPQSIEAAIRKELLPKLFKRVGMDKAKEVIEQVIQITRLGLAKRAG